MNNYGFQKQWNFVLTMFLLFFLTANTWSQQVNPEKYSEVQIHFTSKEQVRQLAEQGLILGEARYQREPGGFLLETVINGKEMEILKKSGFSFTVITDDMVKEYNSRPKLEEAEKKRIESESGIMGMEFGSMGGFYTLDEVVAELDSMRLQYPNLITAKHSIGTSHENRDIWMVKISDNPDISEDEPEVLYDALIHAREPAAMSSVMYFMYYLLENYGTDPEVTYLVNNRELYFIPVLNPDGYEYNRQTNPNGGGMWRKNRRDNGGGVFGVDLNRNYGYKWGYDNLGSSNDPADESYRGPSAFSEPETQAYRDFCINHSFVTNLSYHTYSDVLLYPWGYINALTPDSTIFKEYASDMTQYNNYGYGNVVQAIGYTANGGTFDWMYGEQTSKNKIISMTPEVGGSGDGFWPPQNRIYPLAQENFYPNLFLAWAAGGFVKKSGFTVIDGGNQNGYIDPCESADIFFNMQNIGLGDASNVTFKLTSSDQYVTVNTTTTTAPVNILSRQEALTDTFSFSIAANTPQGHTIVLELEVNMDGVVKIDTIKKILVGTPVIAFVDDAESGISGWSVGQGWNTTTSQYHSTGHSFTDSPFGNYSSNADNSFTSRMPFDFSDASKIFLEYWTKWDIERDFDFGQVLVSTDSATWTSMSGLYTVAGSGYGIQTTGESGYEDNQTTWVKECMDLSNYAGQAQLYIRFNLKTDDFVEKDGWYLDDIKIQCYGAYTGIVPKDNIPGKFSLEQNYPNPFNPVTTVGFYLPQAGEVTLKIYDIRGREVTTLLRKYMAAGRHEMRFNAAAMASGIYFYQLTAGTFSAVKKMMLLK